MLPEHLRALAQRQAGVFTRTQALSLGMSRHGIERRLLDGDWRLPMRDVIQVSAAPVTEAMRLWTGVLAVGAPVAVAGGSAGAWWGLDRVVPPPVPHLVVPTSRRLPSLHGLNVRAITLRRWQPRLHCGLPVVAPAAAIRDLAMDHPAEEICDVVQHALRRRQVTLAQLAEQCGRGVAGAAALRKVLEVVAPGYQVKWQRLVHRALLSRGVVLTPQLEVGTSDGRRAFLDLGDARLRFGVEIDGFVNHMARFTADRRRSRMLALELGWTIATFTAEEVARDLHRVVDEIVTAVGRRRTAARTDDHSAGERTA